MTPETAQLAVAMDEALTDPESLKALLDYLDHPAVKAIMDTPERRQRLAAVGAMVESEVESASEAGGYGDPIAPAGCPTGSGSGCSPSGTMPVHRRGRASPFGSMCVMCGAVTWRGR